MKLDNDRITRLVLDSHKALDEEDGQAIRELGNALLIERRLCKRWQLRAVCSLAGVMFLVILLAFIVIALSIEL